MRNWNYREQRAVPCSWGVFTLPMRNWNRKGSFITFKTSSKFLLYLWGIETTPQIWLLTRKNKVFTLPMRNWNYTKCCRFTTIFTSFYFTYEELKHKKRQQIMFKLARFLLYLWGIETQYQNDKYNTHNKFLLYLWGIETAPLKWPANGNTRFLLYLWGIETYIQFSWIWESVYGFYFTYEELKLDSLQSTVLIYQCFYFTYEELKHRRNINYQ